MTIYCNADGSSYEYTPSNGLLSKDGVIISGERYEPVFTRDPEGSPSFCGIFFVAENKFLSQSGNLSNLL